MFNILLIEEEINTKNDIYFTDKQSESNNDIIKIINQFPQDENFKDTAEFIIDTLKTQQQYNKELFKKHIKRLKNTSEDVFASLPRLQPSNISTYGHDKKIQHAIDSKAGDNATIIDTLISVLFFIAHI